MHSHLQAGARWFHIHKENSKTQYLPYACRTAKRTDTAQGHMCLGTWTAWTAGSEGTQYPGLAPWKPNRISLPPERSPRGLSPVSGSWLVLMGNRWGAVKLLDYTLLSHHRNEISGRVLNATRATADGWSTYGCVPTPTLKGTHRDFHFTFTLSHLHPEACRIWQFNLLLPGAGHDVAPCLTPAFVYGSLLPRPLQRQASHFHTQCLLSWLL